MWDLLGVVARRCRRGTARREPTTGAAVCRVDTRPQAAGVRAQNETLFLLNLPAYEVVHAGRCVHEQATGPAGACARLRDRVLCVQPAWSAIGGGWGEFGALDWASG